MSPPDETINLQGIAEAENALRAQILASLAPQYTFTCLVSPSHPLVPPARPNSVFSVDSDLSFQTAPEDLPQRSTTLELKSYLGSSSLFDSYAATLSGHPLIARILDPSLSPGTLAKARAEAELYAELESLQGQVIPRFYGLWHGKLEDLVGRGEYERQLLVMLLENCGERLDKLFARGGGASVKPEDVRRLFSRLRESGEVAGDVYCLPGGQLRIAGLRPASRERVERTDRPRSVDTRLANTKQPPQRPHPRRPPPPPPMPKLPPAPPSPVSPVSPVSPPPPSPCQKSEAGQPLPEPPKSASSSYIAGGCSPTSSVSSKPSVKFPDRPISLPPPPPVIDILCEQHPDDGNGDEEGNVGNRASVLTFNQGARSLVARSCSPPPELVSVYEDECPKPQLRKKKSWLRSKPSLRSLRLFRRKEKDKAEDGPHLEVVV